MGSCQSSTRERAEQHGQMSVHEAPSSAEGGLESSKNNECSLPPMQRYELLGLGRGVDITKETPWLEKTAFQVRRVDQKDIVETDEGGLLRGYDELVSNNTTIHYEVRAGIKAPHTPLSIGLDTEYSRNYFSSRHVVGTRVKNRTISFRVDFDDVPKLGIKNVKEAKQEIIKAKKQPDQEIFDYNEDEDESLSPSESPIQKTMGHGFFNSESFEKRLCEWLIESLKYRGITLKENQSLHDRIYEDCKSADEDILGIENDIFHFIYHFGVTHYISSIELGGLEYSVITEREHEKQVTVGGEGAISTHSYGGLESSARQTFQLRRKMKFSERKQIGKIKNDQVLNDDEEVIGYKIHPISSLVKNPYLEQALRAGIEKYAEMKSNGGPYLVTTCGDRTMYLAVDRKSKRLTATFNRDEAVEFSVKILNESFSHHELEFTLTSTMTKRSPIKRNEGAASASNECALLPLEYYIETRISPLTGKGSQPRMWINPHYKNTRMILKKRTNPQISGDVKEWIKGRDAYYIRCLQHCNSGYLCIKKRNRQRNQEANEDQGIPQEYQQETSAPHGVDQQGTATPQGGQQVVPTPQGGQQMVPTPQGGQQMVSTPQDSQQMVSTPQDGQQMVPTPRDGQQMVPTPQDGQQMVPTPRDGQQMVPTPRDGQQMVPTPQDGQQMVPTPQGGQQMVPTPRDGQQMVPTPRDGQQMVPTPRDGQKMVPTPQDSQQVIRTPQDGQQVIRTPRNTCYKVCIKPSVESHCDNKEVFMLFRLQPAK